MGIVYDFSVYVCQQDVTYASIILGTFQAVAIRLAENLPKNVGHKLYIDNLFTSILLFKHLKSQGIWAIGTKRRNHLKSAEKILQSKKQLSKDGRGTFEF